MWHYSLSTIKKGGVMKFAIGLCWVITAIATLPAAFYLYLAVMFGGGAPQQAAGAAIALALVVIPYVFTRAMEGMSKD
jgi:hypothetical protein